MNKLLLLVAGLAAACGDSKKPNKQTEPAKGSASSDPAWVERLPQIAEGDTQLFLETAAGLVGIGADGSIRVAKPPAASTDPRHLPADPLAGATPAQLAELTEALGIPAGAPRAEAAFAPTEKTSDAAPGPENAADAHFALLGHPSQASGAPPLPTRATSVFALAHAHDVTAGVIVFADARAPASVLVDVLAQTGGFLAVRRGRELGALPFAFDRRGPAAIVPGKPWTEVRLGGTIEVESVPSKASSVASVDKLAAAVTVPAADVLVSPQTAVQDLVTAVGSLRAAKVDALGFGRAPAPGSAEAATRGEQGPRVVAWDFAIQGQGDAAAIRAGLDGALEPVRICYIAELAKAPQLAGTAQVQLLVTSKASVGTVEVVDVPPALVKCVTTAVKAAKFPPAGSAAGAIVMAKLGFIPR